jgi:hypothetical protein
MPSAFDVGWSTYSQNRISRRKVAVYSSAENIDRDVALLERVFITFQESAHDMVQKILAPPAGAECFAAQNTIQVKLDFSRCETVLETIDHRSLTAYHA